MNNDTTHSVRKSICTQINAFVGRPRPKNKLPPSIGKPVDDAIGSADAEKTGANPKQQNAEAGKSHGNKKGPRPKPTGQAITKTKDAVEQSDEDFSDYELEPDPSAPPPLFDAAEVRRTLTLLLPPGQVTELRALEATLSGDRSWPATLSGYFDDPVALVASLRTIGNAKGIYLIPNPVNPALLARAANRIKRAGKGDSTGDRDIVVRRWLLVDCDPVRPAGISSTDEEHEAALARAKEVESYMRGEGWPEPIVADSGNGGHLLFRIDLPADDKGIIESCLKALDACYTDDVVTIDTSVFNPARIWKLYGTAACKGDHTPDRPHRISRILSAPGES